MRRMRIAWDSQSNSLRSRKDRIADLSGTFAIRGLGNFPDSRAALRSTSLPGAQWLGWLNKSSVQIGMRLSFFSLLAISTAACLTSTCHAQSVEETVAFVLFGFEDTTAKDPCGTQRLETGEYVQPPTLHESRCVADLRARGLDAYKSHTRVKRLEKCIFVLISQRTRESADAKKTATKSREDVIVDFDQMTSVFVARNYSMKRGDDGQRTKSLYRESAKLAERFSEIGLGPNNVTAFMAGLEGIGIIKKWTDTRSDDGERAFDFLSKRPHLANEWATANYMTSSDDRENFQGLHRWLRAVEHLQKNYCPGRAF